jgi:hypothetical protein
MASTSPTGRVKTTRVALPPSPPSSIDRAEHRDGGGDDAVAVQQRGPEDAEHDQ